MSPSPVIIVTGAAGNLGSAVTATMNLRGARVVALDRHQGDTAPSGTETGHELSFAVDLTDPAAVTAVIADVMKALGRIDGLVHTVGGFAYAPVAQSDMALFEGMFRLNVLTTVNVLGATVPVMREAGAGSIVAVAAGAALKAPAGLAAYAAAKSGVLRIVESFAEELKDEGVRINAVLPSIIDTPQNRADMPGADPAKWVRTDEIAAAVAFLLSDESSAITGAAIPLPGRV